MAKNTMKEKKKKLEVTPPECDPASLLPPRAISEVSNHWTMRPLRS